VTAIDISEEKLELARNFGAADALNAATTDVVKQHGAAKVESMCHLSPSAARQL